MLITQNLIIFIISVIALVFSADMVLKSISNYARKIGITEFLVGFVIVSVGTSLPELTTAIMGSTSHLSQIVLGDVIGANIIDITLVLGLMAILAKKIRISSNILGKRIIMTMTIVTIPLVLSLDGKLSRFDGVIMLLAYCFYIFDLFLKERDKELIKLKKNVPLGIIYKDMLMFIVFLPILLVSAYFVVHYAKLLAKGFGLDDYIIGLVLVALGTTLPELTIELRSIRKGMAEIGVGDIVGSVIVNSSLVLGIASILNPIAINLHQFATSSAFMITIVFIGLIFLKEKKITWKEGIALLLLYTTFLLSQVILV